MKLDAIVSVTVSNVASFFVAAAANLAASFGVVEADAPASIFWWAFGGAGLAALFTAAPAFDDKSGIAPRAVAYKCFVTLTAGFLFAFACADFLNAYDWPVAGPLNLPPPIVALFCGLVGEKFFSLAFHARPADWWRWLSSLRPGGGK